MSNKTTKPPKKNVLALDGMTIEIESFKENKYDRGTKKVFVNFEHWGFVRTEFHGSNGTSFHLSDLQGRITKPLPLPNQPRHRIDVKVHSPNKRHMRIDNIGKTNPKPIPTNESIILRMIAEAIENGWFRSPATRDAEREAVRAEGYRLDKAAKNKQETAWNNRIDHILKLGFNTSPDSRGQLVQFEAAQLRQAIADAMKWAQTQ